MFHRQWSMSFTKLKMEQIIQREHLQREAPFTLTRPSILNRRTMWALIAALAIAWSIWQTGLFQRDLINEGGWALVIRFLQAFLHPELSKDFLALTLDSTLITLAYAVCGTTLSLLIGIVGGIFSAEVWWESLGHAKRGKRNGRASWVFVRGFLAVPRAIHEIVWGLFFINILGLAPLTAILAIAIPFGAYCAKVFSEILDETPRAPLNALLNSGATPLKAFTYSLLPQAFPNLLSYSFYRFECSIRSATVLGIIGAGGLGYQILLSLQSVRYEQIWTLMAALFILSGSTDLWSSVLRRRLGSANRIEINLGQWQRLQLSRRLKLSRRQKQSQSGSGPVVRFSMLAGASLVIFSFWYVKADFGSLLSARTAGLFMGVLHDSFPPRVEISQMIPLFNLASQTLAISILAMAGAGLVGILASFPAANNFMLPGGILDTGRQARQNRLGFIFLFATRGILLAARAIPTPIWALILLFVFFPGILPGAIALGVHNWGISGRLMAEVTENMDDRPLRALKAQGASGPLVFLYGVLPDTLPGFVSYILYRWENCIRETVIVGLVGAGGLGYLLSEQLSSFDYHGVLTTLLVLIGLTFLVDLVSATMRGVIRAG
jgi:phosphonate transport system permease protein